MALLIPRTRALVVLAALSAVTCGDPLVDKSFQGTPLFTLQGQTYGTSYQVQLDNPRVRLALFWNTTGIENNDVEKLIEQPSAGLNTEVPLAFTLNLFEVPSEALMLRYGTARFGIGRLLAYVDANGNSLRDASEAIVGLDGSRFILYAPEKIEGANSPTTGDILPGFHIASLPLPCNGNLTPPDVSTGDCGVPNLGGQCHDDKDCGAGVCLTRFLLPWPGGYCVVKDPPPDKCIPAGSVLARGPMDTKEAYYVHACLTDADCKREFPYVCDLKNAACMPTAMQQIQIGDTLKSQPFCVAQAVQGDGGMPPGDGGECRGMNGEILEMLPDGGCPMPPRGDGGMMPPRDGGGCPGPGGETLPFFPDGGCPMGPPDGGGMECMPGPDGGIPPRFPDGGCPGPPA